MFIDTLVAIQLNFATDKGSLISKKNISIQNFLLETDKYMQST